ncbi:hypothetical protein [Prosthecobacter sp.]|uniref:hypothetical protein n=1 Tax=Prosthecobacter sp. TaxID=1965333 RepID=UPI003783AD1C
MTTPKKFSCGLPLLTFTAASCLGLGVLAGFYLKDHLSTTAKAPAPAEASKASAPVPAVLVSGDADAGKDETPQEAKAAVTALKKFLTATTVDERLRHTLGGEAMKPRMERYYHQSAEAPVTVDLIKFVRMDPNPELGSGRHCIFTLESKAWEFAVPVMLEEKPDGFKVDWVAFVEFKDRLLEKFFQAYREEPMRFHVGIQRAHSFNNEVPDIAGKDCFQISPAPPNPFKADALLDKSSEVAEKLRAQMPWETHIWAVVELTWKKQGAQQWVELKSVPQMHWYSLPEEEGGVPPKK